MSVPGGDATNRKYYAVRVGSTSTSPSCIVRSAIFLHWYDVARFRNVEFDTFDTMEEAEAYLIEGESKQSTKSASSTTATTSTTTAAKISTTVGPLEAAIAERMRTKPDSKLPPGNNDVPKPTETDSSSMNNLAAAAVASSGEMERRIAKARAKAGYTVPETVSSSGGLAESVVSSSKVASAGQKPSSASSINCPVPSSTSNQTINTVPERPAKKGKVEEYFLEIKWYEYTDDGDITHSIFADEIPKGTKFGNSRPFLEKEQGENHEYTLYFCLVDSKSANRKVLVEIGALYWILPINLMHFHIRSQDLANFCRKLWVAAGKNEDVYDDMSIEFGESKYSKVEIKKLVGMATGIKKKSDILYVESVTMHPGSTVQDSIRLLEMIFKTCTSAIFIAYEIDLQKLGVDKNATAVGFKKMRNYSCYIGPTRKFQA